MTEKTEILAGARTQYSLSKATGCDWIMGTAFEGGQIHIYADKANGLHVAAVDCLRDAEFIVRAANSHDELVNACKEALDQVLGFDDSFCEICNSHAPKKFETGEIVGPVPHKGDCAIRLLNAAVAKAEGV